MEKIQFPSNSVLSEYTSNERVPKNQLLATVEPTAFAHSFRLEGNIPTTLGGELRYTVLDTARTERSEPRPSNASIEIRGSDMKGITERSI